MHSVETRNQRWRGDQYSLFEKKQGRPTLLGQELDTKVQLYIKKVRQSGGAVSARIVMAAARGILLKCNQTMLAEFGEHVNINQHWAHSLLARIYKVCPKKGHYSQNQRNRCKFWWAYKKSFLADVKATVTMEEIHLTSSLIGIRPVLRLCHVRHGRWINEVLSR